jgi:hypothetical protein
MERRALGWLAFSFCFVPVAFIALLFGGAVLHRGWPDWLFTAGLLATIITAGLQFAVWAMLAEAAGDRVPESEKLILRLHIRHPFWLFEFWWRYVRTAPEAHQADSSESSRPKSA